jgi:hypothetical protein
MHQRASKIRHYARLSLYWSNTEVDIANATVSCADCTSQLPSLPAEPLKPHQPAKRPFEILHTDIGEVDGRHFLVIVDQFSGWPAVTTFPDKHTPFSALYRKREKGAIMKEKQLRVGGNGGGGERD